MLVLLVGGGRYHVELIELCKSWPGHHGHLKKITWHKMVFSFIEGKFSAIMFTPQKYGLLQSFTLVFCLPHLIYLLGKLSRITKLRPYHEQACLIYWGLTTFGGSKLLQDCAIEFFIEKIGLILSPLCEVSRRKTERSTFCTQKRPHNRNTKRSTFCTQERPHNKLAGQIAGASILVMDGG